ncbi:unnamed protein product [Bursaphelenchus xylophilus]|uniref:(pine wood nematode) hypothetical protein n=1 Tax=Bursaphelenchus xylophilus TaxID=6326 RepID=A0A1I7RWP7_BURXY|nr:unnamed protein product [Bursaphelenchus xylophilus]CAG9128551.1 unnamed protein product [Bursaphelenchus xylophilus]
MNGYVLCLLFSFLQLQAVAEIVKPLLQGLAPGDVIYLSGIMTANDEVEIHFHYRALNDTYDHRTTSSLISMEIQLSSNSLSVIGSDLLGPTTKQNLTINDIFTNDFDILLKVTNNRYQNSLVVDRRGKLNVHSVFIDGIQLVHIVKKPDNVQFGIDSWAAAGRIMQPINFTYERGFEFTFTPGQLPMSFNFLDADDNILAQFRITPQQHNVTIASHFGYAWKNKMSFTQFPGVQCYVQNKFSVVNTFHGLFMEYDVKKRNYKRCFKHTTPRPWQAYAKLLVIRADGWVDRIRELGDSTPECVNAL